MERLPTLLLFLLYSSVFVLAHCYIQQEHYSPQKPIDSYSRMEMENLKSDVKIPGMQPNPNPYSEPPHVWHSLWDSWNYDGDKFNTVKVPKPANAKEVISSGKNVVISLSHTMKNLNRKRFTQKERQMWRSVLRGRSEQIQELDPQRTIIFLWDEPMVDRPIKRFTREELEWMVTTAKEEIGKDYRFGFSFTRNTMKHRELPKNVDFVFLPMYLFFDEGYPDIQIWNRREFDNQFDAMIVNARKKLSSDIDIFVIAQGFYSRNGKKWRKPPIEAPEWYVHATWRNSLQGIVWWFYKGNDGYAGMKEMPEYFEAIIEANDSIPDQ